LLEQLQSLTSKLTAQVRDAGDVTTRTRQALDQARNHGIDAPAGHNERNCARHFLYRLKHGQPCRHHNHIDFETNELAGEMGNLLGPVFSISILDSDVLAFDIAQFAQRPAKLLKAHGAGGTLDPRQESYPSQLSRLLPLSGCAQRNEHRPKRKEEKLPFPAVAGCLVPVACLHRITRSALARTSGGMVSPICLAVLRSITSSNLVGC
jgi:hypothetical protein